MTLHANIADYEEQQVLDVLATAGRRGASHEDFVEAGLAGGYIAILHRMVDEDGLQLRTDFTTGQARWALDADADSRLHAA